MLLLALSSTQATHLRCTLYFPTHVHVVLLLHAHRSGAAGYGGYVLGQYELDRRQAEGFHAGGVLLTLIVVCMVSALLVYDWMAGLIQKCLPKRAMSSVRASYWNNE